MPSAVMLNVALASAVAPFLNVAFFISLLQIVHFKKQFSMQLFR
jgi:hypothetical protein